MALSCSTAPASSVALNSLDLRSSSNSTQNCRYTRSSQMAWISRANSSILLLTSVICAGLAVQGLPPSTCADTSSAFIRSVSPRISRCTAASLPPTRPQASSTAPQSTAASQSSARSTRIIVIMKVRTASTKKPMEERPREPATPRVRRSQSATKTNYLQLQLDASGSKRTNLERALQGRERRIADLEKELREYQEVIVATGTQLRDTRTRLDHERTKGERAQQELRDAVALCRSMKDKCEELMERNRALERSETEWRAKAEAEERKVRELKELRRREKREIKELVAMLLGGPGQPSDSEQLKKLSKML